MGYLGANIDAGVNAGMRGRKKVSLRDATIVRDKTSASDVTHRKYAEVSGELKES